MAVGLSLALCAGGLTAFAGGLLVAGPAAAAGASVYAAADGAGTTCTTTSPCSLTTALGQVSAGRTIDLTTAGVATTSASYYDGGFAIATAGTSATTPVTIQPMTGVTAPILDGGTTATVLTMTVGVHLDLTGVTVQHGHTTTSGGGVQLLGNDTLIATHVTFQDNHAGYDGGAIDSGSHTASSSTVTVTDSTFTDNTAVVDGGAVDSGDDSGTGTLTVRGDTTFTTNTAGYDGGAVDSGDDSGTGTATISGATFSGNKAT